jgi:hypothetical protein
MASRDAVILTAICKFLCLLTWVFVAAVRAQNAKRW